jgi:minor extracellular serine protease Vpr
MWKFPAAIAAALLSASMMTHAQSVSSIPMADNETSDRWFVELSSAPSSDGTAVSTLEREESNFHAAAAAAGIRYKESRHFRDLFNGLTVRATERDAAKLRGLAGVRSVYRDVKISVGDQEVPPGNVAELITALAQTGADVAQSVLGLTGRGVRVAVIDTGVDYDHPDLGGGFGPGFRVERGFDFVGDDFDNDTVDTPTPDPDPDDCNGHGTHVAGIIGANGGLTGVAPEVTFNAYRVFGCEGTTTSEIMLDAMELAARDHVDVVNMSIGSALQWPQYPTARAADRLVRLGIVVVASAGNEGALGLYATSAPSVGRDVIGVASFDNTDANLVAFSISPDGARIGYTPATAAPPPPTAGSFPMARTGTTTTPNDGCNALPAGSLAGRAVLIRRGTCSFYQKAFNARSAGAAAVVLYNNVAGFVNPTVAGAPAITIPVVMVTAGRGAFIDRRLATGDVTLTWTDQLASEPNPTANQISSFSSYGPAADLSFKPDIGAPGGIIRSTLPLEQGGYGPLSGTSMAAPHVAGAVALLLQAQPDLSPRDVLVRLQNSAVPKPYSLAPTLGFLDVVHRQGAGMLRIDDAITADAIVTPSSLALGEIENGSATRILRLRPSHDEHRGRGRGRHRGGDDDDNDDNDDERDEPVTYTLGHAAAVSNLPIAPTFVPAFTPAAATVTFDRPTVVVRRDHDDDEDGVTFAVTVQPPPQSTGARLFGGYITLTPEDGGRVLRVPYMGYNGDYQAIQVFTIAGIPALAKLTPQGLVPQLGATSFSLVGNDLPYVLLHFHHQVANLKIEVFDVTTGKSMKFAENEDFLPRNQGANGVFVFPWDGTTTKRPGGAPRAVPNGIYRLELSVLKALGDPRNPTHFERWTSPNIAIARPVPTTP